jgi:hypothetical protein
MGDDLVERLNMVDATMNPMTLVIIAREAASRIEYLEEALRLADAALRGANMNMNVVQKKVSAALGEKKDG